MHAKVAATKTSVMEPEICVARGRIFSGVSKASALNSCMPPTCSSGRTETAMTMMPRPPSHCSTPRHRFMPGESASRSPITVAPVVVRPEIDSKNASVKLGTAPESHSGTAPSIDSHTQTSTVITKACRVESRVLMPREDRNSAKPMAVMVVPESAKLRQSSRSATMSTTIGSAMAAPSAVISVPSTSNMGRKSRARTVVGTGRGGRDGGREPRECAPAVPVRGPAIAAVLHSGRAAPEPRPSRTRGPQRLGSRRRSSPSCATEATSVPSSA